MCYFLANYVPKTLNYANCTIFLSENFKCFNLLSLQIFFGSTFKCKIIHFQSQTRERKSFCHQIHRGRARFSFPSCDWLYFFQSQQASYKRTRAQVPTASSVECQECLVDLRYLLNPFCNSAVAICCKNVPYLWEKNFHASLKV